MENLGYTAKDVITGFTGIITGHVKYITGCNQYLLVAKATKDGIANSLWVDEARVEIISKKKLKIKTNVAAGFDVPAPVR